MSKIDKALRFFTGLDELDAIAATEAFAEDASYYGIEYVEGRIRRKLYPSRQAARQYLGDWVKHNCAGLKYTIMNTVADDKVVMVEWRDVAKDAAGREYRNNGVLVFEFNEDEQIQAARAYYDFTPMESWEFTEKRS